MKHEKFTDEEKGIFYSQWYYSATRLAASIPELTSVSEIAEHLKLERSLVSKVMEFLLKNKLVVLKNGGFELGPQVTHVGHDSPYVVRHHTNWRLKSLQSMDKLKVSNLYYTGPMVLSETDVEKIRNLLIEVIEKATKIAAPSDSEVLRCLNIDWFDLD